MIRAAKTEDMDKIAEAIAMMIKEGEAASDKALAINSEVTSPCSINICCIKYKQIC